jgi:hypothetical protein
VDKEAGSASVLLSGSQDKLVSGGKSLVITMPEIDDVSDYILGIPVSGLSSDRANGALTLNSNAGSVTLPSNMLTGTDAATGNVAEIELGLYDPAGLTGKARAAVGDRPVLSLTLYIDGEQADWNNHNAPVTVRIPYTPADGENLNAIVIWYIEGDGKLNCVQNGHYDSKTGTVTFRTTHFSLYAVAYNPVSFSDVEADSWYNDAVGFIAARGITAGTGNGNYSPDAKLTRGEFIVMMMKSYGIAMDENPTDNFSDAGSTYYTGYLASAKRFGISAGVGNNMFAPGKEITRQEMFTLLYNALKVIGQLPEGSSGRTLTDFADVDQIDFWANDAMTLLVETGTISGSRGRLNPASTSSRAEMAQVLYNLLTK